MTAKAHENYGSYSPETMKVWKKWALKSKFRDQEFMAKISIFFKTGTVLELGGATGQFVEIIEDLGFNCTGSDYFDFFVDCQQKKGIKALKVDATNIATSTAEIFDNIFAQALSPLQTKDGDRNEMVRKTYKSIWNALTPGGRLIVCQTDYIHSRAKRKKYLNYKEQLSIILEDDIFRVVKVIPHQIIPSGFYSFYNRKFLNWLDFNLGGIFPFRHILVLEKK